MTTTSFRRIELSRLKMQGHFRGDGITKSVVGWSSGGNTVGEIEVTVDIFGKLPGIRLFYGVNYSGGSSEEHDTFYHLVSKPCYFGGVKWFVLCPSCHKSVRILYFTIKHFICRICANLSYKSCNASKRLRGWPFSVMTRDERATELLAKIKRKTYRGVPTRKYLKYLKLAVGPEALAEAEDGLNLLLY